MNFQLYFSARVQKHFRMRAGDFTHDSEVEPATEWYARWRFDFLLVAGGGSQQLFLATNEASLFSFILVVEEGSVIGDLVSLFFGYWRDSLGQLGVPAGNGFVHPTQFLRGRPNHLIGSMNDQLYHARMGFVEDGADWREVLARLRLMPMKKGKSYIRPDEEFERLVNDEPPYPDVGGAPKIIRFPG